MARGKRTSPQTEAEIRSLLDSGMIRSDVATRVGLSPSTISDIANRAPTPLHAMTVLPMSLAEVNPDPRSETEKVTDEMHGESLRQRIMVALTTHDRFASLDELVRVISVRGEIIPKVNAMQALGFLNSRGLVKMKIHRQGSSDRVTELTATPRAYEAAGYGNHPHVGHSPGRQPSVRPGDPTDFRNHGSTAKGGPIKRSQPETVVRPTAVVRATDRPLPAPVATVAPSDRTRVHPVGVDPTNPRYLPATTTGGPVTIKESPRFPLLEELRNRRSAGEERARQLELAAASLPDDEPMRETLLDRALALLEAEPEYTDLEREYLAYAAR